MTANPVARPHRSLAIFGWTLIWLGVLLGGWTVYQLWGTGVSNSIAQDRLREQFVQRQAVIEDPGFSPAPVVDPSDQPSSDQTPAVQVEPPEPVPAVLDEEPPATGEALGWIVIPNANVDDIIVEGVDRETLKKGPGHMPWTPLPGQPGNSVISGHRTTYGAPFFDLDLLAVGDTIEAKTLLGRHTFVVRETLIVEPTDVWVTDPRPGAWLTLTTCTPKYSAAQRLIIFAELVDGPNYTATYPLKGSAPESSE